MQRILRRLVLFSGLAAVLLVLFFYMVYRPWQLTWGATGEEIHREMPGDEIVRNPTFNATRAVTINGQPEEIWPWIIQIGYRKAGFYSHDRLDNDGIPSAETIIPEYQSLATGDSIPLSRATHAEVRALEPNRFLLLVVDEGSHDHGPWTWAWGLYPLDERQTRLVTRLRVQLDNPLSNLLLDSFEIVMMRKCLLGIKRRVESSAAVQAG